MRCKQCGQHAAQATGYCLPCIKKMGATPSPSLMKSLRKLMNPNTFNTNTTVTTVMKVKTNMMGPPPADAPDPQYMQLPQTIEDFIADAPNTYMQICAIAEVAYEKDIRNWHFGGAEDESPSAKVQGFWTLRFDDNNEEVLFVLNPVNLLWADPHFEIVDHSLRPLSEDRKRDENEAENEENDE